LGLLSRIALSFFLFFAMPDADDYTLQLTKNNEKNGMRWP
jgi:hypothetical protein